MTNLKAKINEATQAAAEAQNAKSNKQDDAIIDDALLLPAPVYKQLSFEFYAHLISFLKTFTSVCRRTCDSRSAVLSC